MRTTTTHYLLDFPYFISRLIDAEHRVSQSAPPSLACDMHTWIDRQTSDLHKSNMGNQIQQHKIDKI